MADGAVSRGMIEGLPSFDEFPVVGDAQWRHLAQNALKGAPFERLISKTHDGIAIAPLYSRAELSTLRPIRQKPGAWRIAQRMDQPDPILANAQALQDLENGADALMLVFAGASGAYGFGLKTATAAHLAQALENIEPDLIAWRVDPAGSGLAHASLLQHALLADRHVPSTLTIDFCCDPIGAKLRGEPGAMADMPALAALARTVQVDWGASALFTADGRAIHGAGGSQAQELGYGLAAAAYYLRAMVESGMALEDARTQIAFVLACDADEFLTIAKFRAMRMLWARVEEACGLAHAPIRLHGETAWRMMTKDDPWVNIMRASMAVFGAGIGGADCVTCLPFTQALGLPDGFARRIARNSQLVLLDEAHLAKVDDPAAGAGGFEALTQSLCATAWGIFQSIEAEGGIDAALVSGRFAAQVESIAKSRTQAVSTARDLLTGTSAFAMIDQAPVGVLAPMPHEDAPEMMPIHRASEPFEALRALARSKQVPPKVFLANLGPLSDHAARTSYAAPFFAAGGITAINGQNHVDGNGATDRQLVIDEALASGARLVCICGSDAAYALEVGPLAIALRERGLIVFLAGRPGAREQHLRDAGVACFIYNGCDMVEALHFALGIVLEQSSA